MREILGFFMASMKSQLVIKRQRETRTKRDADDATRRAEFQKLSAALASLVLYGLEATRSLCWAQFILLNSTSVLRNNARWLHVEISKAPTDFHSRASHGIVQPTVQSMSRADLIFYLIILSCRIIISAFPLLPFDDILTAS